MPTAITLAGVDFSASALVKPPPVLPNMDGWAYFGKDLATSQNVGTAGPWTNHTAGAPIYSPAYMHCQNATGGLQTPLSWHAAETMLFASRQVPVASQVGAQALIVSGFNSGFIGYSPYVGVTALQMYNGNTVSLSMPVSPITDWHFFACTIGGNTTPMIYDLTRNLSATGAGPVTNTPSGVNLKVFGTGGTAIGTNNGAVDIAFVANYSGILTKPQIDAIYASVKQSLGLRGIII
jgi:hypothetical protein